MLGMPKLRVTRGKSYVCCTGSMEAAMASQIRMMRHDSTKAYEARFVELEKQKNKKIE
jgi:hypothetical protein